MRISGWDWADKRWLVRPGADARRENVLAVLFVVLLVAAVAAVAVACLVLAVAVARLVLLVLGVATWAI